MSWVVDIKLGWAGIHIICEAIWSSCPYAFCMIQIEIQIYTAYAFFFHYDVGYDGAFCVSDLMNENVIVSKTLYSASFEEVMTSSYLDTFLHTILLTWSRLSGSVAFANLNCNFPSMNISSLHLFFSHFSIFLILVLSKSITSRLFGLSSEATRS